MVQNSAKTSQRPSDKSLQLCKAFDACEAADILVAEIPACCRVCSNQIMWRVELCPSCRGSSIGYLYYHVQAAYKATQSGELRLFFGDFNELVGMITFCFT